MLSEMRVFILLIVVLLSPLVLCQITLTCYRCATYPGDDHDLYDPLIPCEDEDNSGIPETCAGVLNANAKAACSYIREGRLSQLTEVNN